jgi:cytochrome c-type biogenesis protein
MAAISNVGALTAFAAGVISFLSPCVLPLVPGYVAYVSGTTLKEAGRSWRSRLSTILLSVCFVLGFSTIFVVLGASATALGRQLLSYRHEATIVGGAIVALFGLFMTGLIRMPWLMRDLRYHGALRGGRPVGAYALGIAFGFGWTPCIGPVLGAILTMSAISGTVINGIFLLSIYSLGLGVPFLVSGALTDSLLRSKQSLGRAGRVLQFGAGVVMMVVGVAMISGYMSVIAYWLLDNVPILGGI